MPDQPTMPFAPPTLIERAFRRARAELEVRAGFPDDVVREAERSAAAGPRPADRADLTALPFVTIDPPGSRDLDQAVQAERDGDGHRLRYAIADVAAWVERGGAVEREAWRRGVTYYAPDHRETLYPPALSHGAASLLADGAARPAVVFDVRLDARGEVRDWTVARALVRSRRQLTYAELRDHVRRPEVSPLAGSEVAGTLALLGEIGPRRLALEAARGGVSLPVREQHVQRAAAAALGYALAYEEPNEAEAWNAQVSLLAGHLAATAMLEAGVGLLRTMPPFADRDVARFRRVARTLGFDWPPDRTYAEFMHAIPADHPRVAVLVRQARRVMRGADYAAFDGAAPEQPLHGALALAYAHVTAPLRRLADRYVLDLLVTLARGGRPTAAEIATLRDLAPVMEAASRRANALERRVVDVAEAWALRSRTGDALAAIVVDVRGREVEVQVEEPPIRATLDVTSGDVPALGATVRVRVAGVDVAAGAVRLALADAG